MPRKSSRTSGSSPEKVSTAATPRRATRRGQKADEPEVTTEAVVDLIPAHLLRASDESSEQSDNDSDYGSPKKGRGRGGGSGSTRGGRGRKPKEVVVEEKPTPSRSRRGRKPKALQTTIAEEPEQLSQESVHSQTTGDERDETSTQESEQTAEKSPQPQPLTLIEETASQPENEEGEEEEEIIQPVKVASPIQEQEEEEIKEPSPEPIQQQQQAQIVIAEKVSEVEQELQSNNDQAPVNEEENNDDDNDDEDDKMIKQVNEESSSIDAEDEVSKDAPELPEQDASEPEPEQKMQTKDEKVEEPPKLIRSRSSSGEIHDDTCEKMDVDESLEIVNKKKESSTVKSPIVMETKRASPIKEKEVKVDEPKGGHQRKRKWGARKADIDPVIAITTDSLKNVISEEVKPVPLSDVKLLTPSPEREREPEEKRPRTKPTAEEKDAKKKLLMERLRKQEEDEERRNEMIERRQASPNIVVTNGAGKDRKVALVHEDAAKPLLPLSPPKNQTSKVLFITNLVRPMTTVALRSLLSRTGTIEHLWIDGIKSKCYVIYNTEDQAYETRQALHGVKWPEHSLKTLNVEFSTEEEMNKVASTSSGDRDVAAVADQSGRDAKSGFGWSKADVQKSPEDRSKASRRTREWDVGKRDDADWDRERDENRRRRRSSERENRRDRGDRKAEDPSEKKRSVSPSLAADEKTDVIENVTPPGRLLDDLFRKTKAVPCIYWLPLTEEQVREKEEQRQKNLAEHKRRMDEMIKQQKERREAREQRIREREKTRKRSRSNSRGGRRRRSRSNSRGGRNRFDRR